MPNPDISIILPFFNAEPTLKRAIGSIIAQTYTEWELILVDNASADQSWKVAHAFTQADPRISLISEAHRGVVEAFNTGLSHAQGEYIARMDADDVASPTRLQKQRSFMEHHSEVGIVGGRVRYQADSPQTGMQNYVEWVNTLLDPESISLNRFVELPIINPTMMFRWELLEKYGSYRSGDFPEDYELLLRWQARGVTVGKVEDVILDWYDFPQRLTRTNPRYSTEAFYRVKSHYLADWLRHNNPFHPQVVVWGAGRKSRQRARLLEAEGVSIQAYIDVVKDKTKERSCISYQDIAPPGRYFVVSYVGNRGQRQKIRQFLIDKGYQEGVHFLLAA